MSFSGESSEIVPVEEFHDSVNSKMRAKIF